MHGNKEGILLELHTHRCYSTQVSKGIPYEVDIFTYTRNIYSELVYHYLRSIKAKWFVYVYASFYILKYVLH